MILGRSGNSRGCPSYSLKVYEKGVERRDITYFMQVNNWTPTFLGDLRAQVGAAELGVRRLKEVLARHGTATVRRAVQEMIEFATRRFREEVSSWSDGVYESDVYVCTRKAWRAFTALRTSTLKVARAWALKEAAAEGRQAPILDRRARIKRATPARRERANLSAVKLRKHGLL